MALLHDIQTAQRVLVRLVRSRNNRKAVEAQEHSHPLPAPGSIDIAVYFADTKVNMYQIRQWYAPLAEIAATWPVTIISRSPSSVLALWEEAPVPALYLRRVTDLEQ